MTRALITGGAGFIGTHLAANLLGRGWQVDLLDNFSRGVQDDTLRELMSRRGCRLFSVDLLQDNALKDLQPEYDRIFHLAAIIGVRNVLERPYEVLRDNTEMLVRMIEFSRMNASLKRFLFASTSEVYAGTLTHFTLPLPTPETVPLALPELDHPRTSYMLSKLYGEALCHHSGLPFALVRPHNFYGPRMGLSHVIPELLKKAVEAPPGSSIEVFSVNHKRTFCYISDAVEMMARAAELGNCCGQTLNIGNESPEVSIGELAARVIEVVGKPLEIIPRPATPGSPERRCPSMSRTCALTGYSSKVPLEEGIRRTYDWYRVNVFRPGGVSAR